MALGALSWFQADKGPLLHVYFLHLSCVAPCTAYTGPERGAYVAQLQQLHSGGIGVLQPSLTVTGATIVRRGCIGSDTKLEVSFP